MDKSVEQLTILKLNKIADRMKYLREKQKMSYRELEKLTGIAKSTLQRYETGSIKSIPFSKIDVLANALNTTKEWLLDWNNEPMNEPAILFKYNKLDSIGKEKVDNILNEEYNRILKSEEEANSNT